MKTSLVFSILNSSGAVLLVPPKKIDRSFYICDKSFALDPILEMYKDEKIYGMIFISGDVFYFYKIIKSGKHLEAKKLCSDDVEIAKKHRKGGQSSVRFSRLRDESIANYIKKVSELAVKHFLIKDNNNGVVKNIIDQLIIAGNGDKKVLLKESDLLKQYFKDIILLNTTEINDEVIHKTIQEYNFGDFESKEHMIIINNIQKMMTLDDKKLLFGISEITTELHNNSVNIIYCSDIETDFINNFNSYFHNQCDFIIIPHSLITKIGINIIALKYY